MTPESEFDQRIAEIHGLGLSSATVMPAKASKTDIRHEEFRALVETFLGNNYDRKKVVAIEEAQLDLHQQQESLALKWQAGKIPALKYAGLVNQVIDQTFQRCEKILGVDDFRKLFGGSPAEVGGHIDEVAFAEAHAPQQAPPKGGKLWSPSWLFRWQRGGRIRK